MGYEDEEMMPAIKDKPEPKPRAKRGRKPDKAIGDGDEGDDETMPPIEDKPGRAPNSRRRITGKTRAPPASEQSEESESHLA